MTTEPSRDAVEAHYLALREMGKKNMSRGAMWCLGGIVVTAVTYQAASHGGTYFVAWGAILFGAVQFFNGVGQTVSARRMAAESGLDASIGQAAEELDTQVDAVDAAPTGTADATEPRGTPAWIFWLIGGAVVAAFGYIALQIVGGKLHW